jgi:hypothetical protein
MNYKYCMGIKKVLKKNINPNMGGIINAYADLE